MGGAGWSGEEGADHREAPVTQLHLLQRQGAPGLARWRGGRDAAGREQHRHGPRGAQGRLDAVR